jgi:hypothetical protein
MDNGGNGLADVHVHAYAYVYVDGRITAGTDHHFGGAWEGAGKESGVITLLVSCQA